MEDEAFKVEMFRFIDVFPYLNSPESIAKHLQEYFSRPDLKLPPILQRVITYPSPGSFPAKVVARVIARSMAGLGRAFYRRGESTRSPYRFDPPPLSGDGLRRGPAG